jgi:transposase-like protein
MPRGYPSLTNEQRQEIMSRIKEKGERVPDLAKEYGVKPQNIYSMLSNSANGSSAMLEISRLKREHEALLKIVGELIVDQKLGKKIQHRYGGK